LPPKKVLLTLKLGGRGPGKLAPEVSHRHRHPQSQAGGQHEAEEVADRVEVHFHRRKVKTEAGVVIIQNSSFSTQLLNRPNKLECLSLESLSRAV
jgi:hypothetical protein